MINISEITEYTTVNSSSISDSHRESDGAKILAITILGLGSFISGLLPTAISRRSRRRFPLLISILLCFGAGVLLATALVHMLPDVRKNMTKNAEIYFGGGFLFIYLIDEFVHYLFGEAIQHSHGTPSSINHNHSTTITNTHQNSNSNENPSRRNSCNHNHHYGTVAEDSETSSLLRDNNQHRHCDTETTNARICHVTHTEPCSNNITGTLGLLCALSLHSFIEGLAIGVQNTKARVLFLLGAVACHKYVMGFCLGLELCSNSGSTMKSQIIAIGVFALGSVFGIGAGMIFVDLPMTLAQSTLPILQAVAGGTLLYVTVCEVMPREKARWHQNRSYQSAGIIQFLAVSIGFTVMTVINFYLDDD